MADTKKPQVKVEEKKLTDGQRYRLLNVHLNDQIIRLERELATTIQQVGQLKAENVDLKSKIHEAGTDIFFKELGIKRGEALQLNDDGTLFITRQVPAKPAKADQKADAPDKAEKTDDNGKDAEVAEPAEAGTGA
jgi:hypothetical protein